MRRPTQRRKPREAEVKSYPAPRNGWIANRNLAQPGARNPDGTVVSGALVLDNFFPTAQSARLRRGCEGYADLDGGTVMSLFSYISGATERLFAADAEKIVDITTTPSDAQTGLNGGDWVSIQFATSGGVFLRLVNGTDTPLVYDGSAFSTSPALTFADGYNGNDTSILNFVWAYQNRLFFVEKDSLDAWYLPVGNIGGELVKLPLGGIFELGGSLLFGAVWSNDSGNQGGLGEQCIFVTTEGEVAVFQGSNPSSVADWGKVGVYRIGRPLGKRAWFRAGSDVFIATSVGLVPISAAVTRDFAAIAPVAASYAIEDAWNAAVRRRPNSDWRCIMWPAQQMALVVPPFEQSLPIEAFVVNLRTGAWCRFTGWDMRSLAVFRERMFFGSTDGLVWEAMVGGLDGEDEYSGTYVPLFEDFGSPANRKIARLARASLRARTRLPITVAGHSNFETELPPPPEPAELGESGIWGAAIWGSSSWGDEVDLVTVEGWQSISATGSTLAVSIQVSSGDVVPMDAEIVRLDVTFVSGDVVT